MATIVDPGPPTVSSANGTADIATPDAAPARTTIPQRPATSAAPPRRVGGASFEEVTNVVGALLSALATTLLIFGRLTPLSGRIGFALVFFFVFLATYAGIVSMTNDLPAVTDKVMTAVLAAAAALTTAALLSVVLFVAFRAGDALSNFNLFYQDMSAAGPQSPLSQGGIVHAIIGTLIIMSIVLALTVPLGIACAVYLNEVGGRSTEFVRTIVTAMTGLPSVLAGLFILATFILILGFPRSGLAGALAVSIMVLPIVIRSSDLVLRLVPNSLREASAATGASQWRTVWHVVLPTARSGLANAVLLGLARGVGETAPVLLVTGIGASTNLDPTQNPMMSLPLAVFDFVRSPLQTQIQRGFATAATLMILVIVLFTLARVFGGRPAGRLSKRQTRKAAAQSMRDLHRIEGARP